jgi:hypothetical protein
MIEHAENATENEASLDVVATVTDGETLRVQNHRKCY